MLLLDVVVVVIVVVHSVVWNLCADGVIRSTRQVNGEIYNHEALKESMKGKTYHTQSDCEVIAHLVS